MNKPVMKFSAGTVSAALWNNDITVNGRSVTVLKASIERRFKDKDGVWKSSTSFSRNEIPLAIYCLSKAYAAILEDRGSQNELGDDEVIA